MVSLLSVWVLVGLFYYLNRYTRRGIFHDLDGGGVAVLRPVADIVFAHGRHGGRKLAFHGQAIVCFAFGGFAFVGQHAIYRHPSPTDIVRPVHAFFDCVDDCQSADEPKMCSRSRCRSSFCLD